jgi:hypothetical protein
MTEARTPLHTRTIRLDGFARADGLFDVEARLIDVKHYDLPDWSRGPLPAGEPMHDMVVTMTVDADGIIRGFEARAESSPHVVCQSGATNFGRLVGLSISKGFLKRAAERIGGIEGCTHIREMLQQMATVAFQSVREARIKKRSADPSAGSPLIDSCAAWSSAGEWVRLRFPAHYTGPARSGADAGADIGAGADGSVR